MFQGLGTTNEYIILDHMWLFSEFGKTFENIVAVEMVLFSDTSPVHLSPYMSILTFFSFKILFQKVKKNFSVSGEKSGNTCYFFLI